MSQKVVKLSAETLAILKIAAAINKSLAFKAGSEIKTISTSGSIVMESAISETFPNDFAIYELPKFLGVLALPAFKDAELVFEEGVDTHLVIKSGNAKIKYFYSPESFTEHPGKQIVLPKVDVEVMVQKDVLDNLEKTASALGHKFIKFAVSDKKLYLIATTPGLDTSNDYVLNLGDTEAEDFEALIKLENLKLLGGDFKVQLLKMGNKGISRWEHMTRKIVTFIGLEMQ